ncbi:hypothetical protein [Streptomyces sp. NPDC047079]|uniref:hypothetical protein n=1 Tax=Streptomyces sp. NPDC047079 TaxID=3154607 RepID=UPI0033FA247D
MTPFSFPETDPRQCWEAQFTRLDGAVAEAGPGKAELVAPFMPAVPGTDRYVSGLR